MILHYRVFFELLHQRAIEFDADGRLTGVSLSVRHESRPQVDDGPFRSLPSRAAFPWEVVKPCLNLQAFRSVCSFPLGGGATLIPEYVRGKTELRVRPPADPVASLMLSIFRRRGCRSVAQPSDTCATSMLRGKDIAANPASWTGLVPCNLPTRLNMAWCKIPAKRLELSCRLAQRTYHLIVTAGEHG
jgi:hypothetical protein